MERKILSSLCFVFALLLEYKITSAGICASSPTVLRNSTGNFSSPNYPNNYPNNTVVTWKIIAPVGQMIDLYFVSFSLEGSSSCKKDYVKIRNRCGDAVPMATYCDHTAKPVRSSNNVLWVEFRSDDAISNKGFEAFYTIVSNASKLISCPRPSDNPSNIDYCPNSNQVQCCDKDDSNCRVNKILTDKRGTITSPGYPGRYPHGTSYFWRITVPEGYVVQINFTTFATHHKPECSDLASKCKCDFVHVLDGPCPFYHSGTRWCGRWTSMNLYPSYITTGRHMVVFFRSNNDDDNEIGFSANYRRALKCSGSKPISCTKNSRASCCIREARTCSSQTLVRSHCPRDGDPADHNVCCTVNGSPSCCIREATECWFDTSVRSHCPRTGEPAGHDVCCTAHGSPVCCYNPLSSICSSTPTIITARYGKIKSPNYPNQYPNNATKIWKIVAPVDYVIDVYFEAFELEENRKCDRDFVQLRNKCDEKFFPERYCGNEAKSFRSASNVLWFEFRSDFLITKKGFAAIFALEPKSSKPISCPRPSDDQSNIDHCLDGSNIECCNRNSPKCKFDKLLTAKNGTFASPNYPNKYPPNTKLTWRITVPEGFLVQLNFTKFKIHSSNLCSSLTCNCDYVSVRDGPCSNVAEKKWCTNDESKLPSYISTGRHLLVHFKSDSVHALEGFEAIYRRALKCTGDAPYSCLKEGIPACCKENGKTSSASKATTKMWFILIIFISTLSTTLV